MPRRQIIQTSFQREGCFIEARVAIVNLRNDRKTTITISFMLDTGFSGGIHIPFYYVNDARIVGVEPRPATLRLGGGRKETSYTCFGCLEKIDGHNFPNRGIETEIHLHGNESHGYIGLDVMKEWITEFDGPATIVTISQDQED